MRCLQRERHDRYPDWKTLRERASRSGARRGITLAPFVPKMRYQAAARGASVVKARVAGGAVVTGRGRGRASVDVRGAARDVDEACAWRPRGLEGRGRDPVARRPPVRRARAAGRPPAAAGGPHVRARPPQARPRRREAVTALDALSGATEKPIELFAVARGGAPEPRPRVPRRARGARGPPRAPGRRGAPRALARRAAGPGARRRTRSRRRGRGSRSPATPCAPRRAASSSSSRPRACPRRVSPSGTRRSTRRWPSSRRRARRRRRTPWRLPTARALAALERWPEARVVLEGILDAGRAPRPRAAAELARAGFS